MRGQIEEISALMVLDSRGEPTLRARVRLAGGALGVASVPSGASTGAHEAVELRDGESAWGGKGVKRALGNIRGPIRGALIGESALNQARIDKTLRELDGTGDLSRLGGNACLAVSMAVARAAAECYGLPLYRYLGGENAKRLPRPMMNLLNGGLHAANGLNVQEFMVCPLGAQSYTEALRMGAEVYRALGALIRRRGLGLGLGDEGGYAPELPGDEEALTLLTEAISAAGYRPGEDIALAVDVAASGWAEEGGYRPPKGGAHKTREEMIGWVESLVAAYPLISVEDPLGEEDFEGFSILTKKLAGRGVQLVGDDLFTTRASRLERGAKEGAANAILIKPNQIGTVSDTLLCLRRAQTLGYRAIVSHRSGDNCDSFVSDLSVAANAGQVKFGAPARGERTEKYNRLLEIEAETDCTEF